MSEAGQDTGEQMPSREDMYVTHDIRGSRILSPEQKAAQNRLREYLDGILNPDNFSGADRDVIEQARNVVNEPVSVFGRLIQKGVSPETTTQSGREIWSSVTIHDGKHFPVISMTKDANARLVKGENLLPQNPNTVLGWARSWMQMVGNISPDMRGSGDLGAGLQHFVLPKTEFFGGAETFAKLQVLA